MWDRARNVLMERVEKMTPAETVVYAIWRYLIGVAAVFLSLFVVALIFEQAGFVEYISDRGRIALPSLFAFVGMMAYHAYAAAREAQATGRQLHDVQRTGPTFRQYSVFSVFGGLGMHWLIENTGLSSNPVAVKIALALIGSGVLTAMYVVYRTRGSASGDREYRESPAPSTD